eukprot:4618437-Lingulodinium_polyedra.AAC.1
MVAQLELQEGWSVIHSVRGEVCGDVAVRPAGHVRSGGWDGHKVEPVRGAKLSPRLVVAAACPPLGM